MAPGAQQQVRRLVPIPSPVEAPVHRIDDPTGGLTVEVYLERWLAHARGLLRGSTYDGYATLLRRHAIPRIGDVALDALHPLRIQALYAELLADPHASGAGGHLSAKTVGNLHRVLRRSFGQAVRWGMLTSNPAAGAEPPRSRPRELMAVDRELAGRLLAGAVDTRFAAPVAIALCTGLRRGEILGLRWSDVDTEGCVLRVRRSLQVTSEGVGFEEPKTPRSRRAIVLPEMLLPYLDRQRTDQAERRDELGSDWHEQGLLVDRGDGAPWNPDRFSSAWVWFCTRAGFSGVRFHDLRHAHATLMLMQGVHPKIVSERLGHASVGITLDVYSHVLPTMQAEAARSFDRLFAAR